ncbi:MAG: serine/threonine protein kinase [Deltaproteobacteria bacterium]|nr:serine/threonine protein kinase [Deltaproteobacteria bacterium]
MPARPDDVTTRRNLDPRRQAPEGKATLTFGRPESPSAASSIRVAAPPSTAPSPDLGASASQSNRGHAGGPPSSAMDPLGRTRMSPEPEHEQPEAAHDPLAETRVAQHHVAPRASGEGSGRPGQWDSDGGTVDGLDSLQSAASARSDAGADPLIGLVIAERYRIVERIGRGGMGIVYRVEHVRLGKPLAMKLLAGELSSNKEVVRRFKQEALTASKLSNRHTVQVYDYGVWQHLTYLVMELVDGLDLSRVLKREGPLPFARLGRLMAQVCESLEEAHAKGIVHRDIKPENIMLLTDARGEESAKVVDFGLAKLRESPELNDVTMQGTIVGTPYYMSPEQILGEEVDGQTDAYALGTVMYRTLTGQHPFTATTPMAMFSKHIHEPPPSIARTHPELGIPRGVSDAVLRCMAKDRQDRYASIDELHAVLLRELGKLGLAEGLGPPGESNGRASEGPSRATEGDDEAIAIRQELEAYEAQLRRTRFGAYALALGMLVALVASVGFTVLRPAPKFEGLEREPNDNAGTADELPFGSSIRGTVGKRLEERTGDQDVHRVRIPGGVHSEIALDLSPLPTFGLCASLLRVGEQQEPARYCTGPLGGQALEVPRIRVTPGEYLVVVMQDRSPPPESKRLVPVHENISDSYQLTVRSAQDRATDLEPNDTLEGALTLEPGVPLLGSLGFAEDADFLCSTHTGARWTIEDGARRPGTVLEVTPYLDDRPMPLVRIHGSQATPSPGHAPMDADVRGPFTTAACDAARCCLKLGLARDPWAEPDAAGPLPDATRYRVTLGTPP